MTVGAGIPRSRGTRRLAPALIGMPPPNLYAGGTGIERFLVVGGRSRALPPRTPVPARPSAGTASLMICAGSYTPFAERFIGHFDQHQHGGQE
jgi:hypothetical protein